MKVDIKVFSCGKIIFSTLFLVLLTSCSLWAALTCPGVDNQSTYYGMVDGVCKVYHCATGSPSILATADSSYCSGGSSGGSSSDSSYSTSCSSVGSTQTIYTASGCTYSEETLECCSDKVWRKECPACNSFSSTRTFNSSYSSYTFPELTQLNSWAYSNDTCDKSATQAYSGPCTEEYTCMDVVKSGTSYTGTWYETSAQFSSKPSSDQATCSHYRSAYDKTEATQACSRIYVNQEVSGTKETYCYANCVFYSNSYNSYYQCNVNKLICTPAYHINVYNFKCKSDC